MLYIYDRYENHHYQDYWIDPCSVINYANPKQDVSIVSSYNASNRIYTDPLGTKYVTVNQKDVIIDKGPIIAAVTISHKYKDTRTYPNPDIFTKYITISHTPGYSLDDLKGFILDCKYNQETYLGLIPEKIYNNYYNLFKSGKFNNYYHPDINETFADFDHFLSTKQLELIKFDPFQFILDRVVSKFSNSPRDNNYVGVCLNHSNLNTEAKFNKLCYILEDIHKKTGLKFKIRLHNFIVNHLTSNKDFLTIVDDSEMNEFDFMDAFSNYLVDGTGLGYKISYRSKTTNRSCNIYRIDNLYKKMNHNFRGIDLIDCLPQGNQFDLIAGYPSDYSEKVISETYTCKDSNTIPDKLVSYMNRYL